MKKPPNYDEQVDKLVKHMREASVTRRFIAWVEKHGLKKIKLTTLGMRGTSGWPDYLVLGAQQRVAFVELKATDGELTELQKTRALELLARGHLVHVYRGEKFLDWRTYTPISGDLAKWLTGSGAG